ncbi:MAG: hypothetical protein JWL99_792, partial [Streptomyces oryziradicis]|nr:hypothetical protein [Actinacidiphila oryziradicis]
MLTECSRSAWARKFDYGKHTLKVFTSVPVSHFDYFGAWPMEDMIGVGLVLPALALFPLLVPLRPPAVLTVHTVVT